MLYTDPDDHKRHIKNAKARKQYEMDQLRQEAKEALKRQQDATQSPQMLSESITRAAEMNRPDLVLHALLMGHEVHIDGRPVRLANSFELLVGIPKINLDMEMEMSWQPMHATLQGFILLCKGMTDKEAVEAAAATRF